MMSTRRHHARPIPRCRGPKCSNDADLVIAFEDRDAQPYCHPCGNAVRLNTGGTEYPLEEYYTPASAHASQFDPYGKPTFTLFDPDAPDETFLAVDNGEAPNSSVHPHDCC